MSILKMEIEDPGLRGFITILHYLPAWPTKSELQSLRTGRGTPVTMAPETLKSSLTQRRSRECF